MSTMISYHWAEPDPDVVAHQMFSLASELEELNEPMLLAGEIVRADMVENFETGSGPDGISWAPWSPNYESYALAHSSGPVFGGAANLHLTGALVGAVSSPSSYIPTNQGLFLDVSSWPEYWAWNNFGATRSVAGGGFTEDDVIARARQIAIREHRAGNKITGKGALGLARAEFGSGMNELPMRPFVGISAEAQAKLDASFIAWFEGSIAIAVSTRGKPMGRHAKRYPKGTPGGLGGRFMPRDS
jgi:hypothetical protein